DWIIAYFHHPPYTKGSHDSDNFSDSSGRLFYMRENALPILEAGGVDLVLCGHSHSYERSFFINGHYGTSDTFYSPTHVVQSGNGKVGGDGAYMKTGTIGTVYIVGGNSGKVSGTLTQHNAMQAWLYNLGSVVIDVDGLNMNVSFLRELTGPTQIDDYFTISKLQVQPPGAPTNLTAAAVSGNQINLSWSDVFEETGYKIERSEDEQNWSEIATTSQDSTTYNDTNNLQPSITYYYQIVAYNNGGNSPPSNTASATTHTSVEYFVTGETAVSGQVSGNYTDTWNDDDNIQVITEVETGGKPSRRYSYLEHKWHFNVSSGFSVTFYANAYKSNSSEDNFTFQYSIDGQNFVDIAEVNSTFTDNLEVWQLPTTLNGQVDIRVIDSDRTNGNRSLESIHVDKMSILVESDLSGTVPLPPSNLMATAVSASHVSLSWSDNSTDENGFQIERSADSISWSILDNVTAGSTTYEDYTVTSNNTYYYRINAYNGSGSSVYATLSNPVTTPDGIVLSANGYKVKGVHHVDLTWNALNPNQSITIYRGDTIIPDVENDGAYTDNIGFKGNGVYTYHICESVSGTCSNTVDVVF
ncbi:MAG: fibronectin type III domain-containing protein, partial [Planctomycetota bacterium]